jgi:hypothetical protein
MHETTIQESYHCALSCPTCHLLWASFWPPLHDWHRSCKAQEQEKERKKERGAPCCPSLAITVGAHSCLVSPIVAIVLASPVRLASQLPSPGIRIRMKKGEGWTLLPLAHNHCWGSLTTGVTYCGHCFGLWMTNKGREDTPALAGRNDR